jgi:hypothetical protein
VKQDGCKRMVVSELKIELVVIHMEVVLGKDEIKKEQGHMIKMLKDLGVKRCIL